MKKIFIAILISCSCSLLFGQEGLETRDVYKQTSDIARQVRMNQDTQIGMKKSKLNFFLDTEWKGGVMFQKDSVVLNNYLYRYNIYTDQIELRSVVNPNKIDIVSIGSHKFIFIEFFSEDSILNQGYFELLINGECKLLLRRKIKFIEGRDDIDAYGASSSTSIGESLFVKKGDEPAVLIEKSKEDLKEILSDKKGVVDYIDKQLIIFLTEKKIKEIVEYYNEI
ncbi:MAG TPA: hypothetical protein DCG75_05775 [Bacteroidales bacterium]|jgi:hypothetical protein|nr:hypothetical protein [Bacteroidales bacterium]